VNSKGLEAAAVMVSVFREKGVRKGRRGSIGGIHRIDGFDINALRPMSVRRVMMTPP
jgi:hypothetical protein